MIIEQLLMLVLVTEDLMQDETWMTGVNAFYDHEFPNDHKRNGIGFELISSVFETRVNSYNGTTGYIKDKSGTDSKALRWKRYGLQGCPSLSAWNDVWNERSAVGWYRWP